MEQKIESGIDNFLGNLAAQLHMVKTIGFYI